MNKSLVWMIAALGMAALACTISGLTGSESATSVPVVSAPVATPVPFQPTATAAPTLKPEPEVPSMVVPPGWETYEAEGRYTFAYPGDLTLDVRQSDRGAFNVFLEDANNPISVLFSFEELPGTCAESRATGTDLLEPVYTDIDRPGATGYVLKGTVPPGFGGGARITDACFDIAGGVVTFECGLHIRCSTEDTFDRVLDTFTRLDG